VRTATVGCVATALLLVCAPSSSAALRHSAFRGVGSDSYTGTAMGTVVENGTDSNPSEGLTLTTSSEIPAAFSFDFVIDPFGKISGSGSGRYHESSYTANGSWERGPIGCTVPISGSPFRVSVDGEAMASQIFGRLSEIKLMFTLLGAQETSPEVPCGSEFSIFEATTSLLVESLQSAQGPAFDFGESQLLNRQTKTVAFQEAGASGTKMGVWEVELEPSLGWAAAFKSTLTTLAQAYAADGNVLGASTVACGSVPTIFVTACLQFFVGAVTYESAMALLSATIAVDPVDAHYHSLARPAVGRLPSVHAVRGLGRSAVGRLNTLLQAQAKAVGIASALATTVDRFGGAALVRNASWMSRQRLAARALTGRLASALASELSDARAAQRALAATALGARTLGAGEVAAYRKSVRTAGLPAPVSADLTRLRLPSSDAEQIRLQLERANQSLLSTPATLAGALLTTQGRRDTQAAIAALRAIASGHEAGG
jgi:uncharacterized membrane protein